MLQTFPWNQRWLNGAEYEFLIRNQESYTLHFGFLLLEDHPNPIYCSPSHGYLYYLSGHTLRELGFPRIKGLKKRFKWKKMNFITPLPKQRPRVHYLVATGRLGHACYRMHIVSLGKDFPLLCHMLRIQNTFKLGVGIPSRKHFKENHREDDLASSDEPDEESLDPVGLSPRRQGSLHPLYVMAAEERYAPFRRHKVFHEYESN